VTKGGRRLVSQITIWHVAASICYYAVYAGTPFFRDTFSLSGTTVGFVITALTLGYAVFLLPIGVLTDRFGEHRTLTIGLVGLAVGAVLIAVAPTYGLLLVAAFLLGSMYGTATPGTNKAIFDNVEPAWQHRAIGIKQIGPTIGSAISAVLLTGLVGVAVWQTGFLVAAAVGVAVAAFFYLTYSGTSGAAATYPDFRGQRRIDPTCFSRPRESVSERGFTRRPGTRSSTSRNPSARQLRPVGSCWRWCKCPAASGKSSRAGSLTPSGEFTRYNAFNSARSDLRWRRFFFVVPVIETPFGAGIVFSVLGVFALGSTGLYYSCLSTVVANDEIGAASAAGQLAATVGGLFAPPVFGYLIDTVGYNAGWLFLGGLSFLATVIVAGVVVTSR